MRVLLITHYYPEHQSGVELVAGQLAARLSRRGVAITWAASGPLTRPLPDGVVALPMRAWNGAERATGFAYPFWHPADLRRLTRAVGDHDLVHLHEHLYVGNLVAARAARRRGVPLVVTQHTFQIPPAPRLPLLLRGLRLALGASNRTLARRVLGGADRSVFISAKAKEYYERLFRFRRPALYVPNGVDCAIFHPVDAAERRRLRVDLGWPLDRPVGLFVGRMIEKKGLPQLREVAGQFPECDWAFAGWGPVDPAAWGLPNVRVLGRADQPTLARYYRAADLFVLPSLTEGFPLVVQEAMACGTPAVLSAEIAAGAPGVERAMHVWRPDREPLVERVRQVLVERDRWPEQRAEAAAFARQQWDWERCADRYLELFQEVVSPHSGKPRAAANRCQSA